MGRNERRRKRKKEEGSEVPGGVESRGEECSHEVSLVSTGTVNIRERP